MSKDLEIIKELEKKIGRKLERLKLHPVMHRWPSGYAIDEKKYCWP